MGESEGNIAIHWFPHGWFWFIPLLDGVTSVGAVCWPYYLKTRRTDPTTFLKQTIDLCPSLADRLRNAEMVAPATATEWRYRGRIPVPENCRMLARYFGVGESEVLAIAGWD